MIDATIGGASSDSYTSVADADSYHDARLGNDEWYDASTSNKERALKMATRELDKENWKGEIVDTTTPQALRSPRSEVKDLDDQTISSTIIPVFLKNATAELAWELIKSDRTVDSDTAGIKEVVAGSVEVVFDKYDRTSVIPFAVINMVSPYINGGIGPNMAPIQRS